MSLLRDVGNGWLAGSTCIVAQPASMIAHSAASSFTMSGVTEIEYLPAKVLCSRAVCSALPNGEETYDIKKRVLPNTLRLHRFATPFTMSAGEIILIKDTTCFWL